MKKENGSSSIKMSSNNAPEVAPTEKPQEANGDASAPSRSERSDSGLEELLNVIDEISAAPNEREIEALLAPPDDDSYIVLDENELNPRDDDQPMEQEETVQPVESTAPSRTLSDTAEKTKESPKKPRSTRCIHHRGYTLPVDETRFPLGKARITEEVRDQILEEYLEKEKKRLRKAEEAREWQRARQQKLLQEESDKRVKDQVRRFNEKAKKRKEVDERLAAADRREGERRVGCSRGEEERRTEKRDERANRRSPARNTASSRTRSPAGRSVEVEIPPKVKALIRDVAAYLAEIMMTGREPDNWPGGEEEDILFFPAQEREEDRLVWADLTKSYNRSRDQFFQQMKEHKLRIAKLKGGDALEKAQQEIGRLAHHLQLRRQISPTRRPETQQIRQINPEQQSELRGPGSQPISEHHHQETSSIRPHDKAPESLDNENEYAPERVILIELRDQLQSKVGSAQESTKNRNESDFQEVAKLICEGSPGEWLPVRASIWEEFEQPILLGQAVVNLWKGMNSLLQTPLLSFAHLLVADYISRHAEFNDQNWMRNFLLGQPQTTLALLYKEHGHRWKKIANAWKPDHLKRLLELWCDVDPTTERRLEYNSTTPVLLPSQQHPAHQSNPSMMEFIDRLTVQLQLAMSEVRKAKFQSHTILVPHNYPIVVVGDDRARKLQEKMRGEQVIVDLDAPKTPYFFVVNNETRIVIAFQHRFETGVARLSRIVELLGGFCTSGIRKAVVVFCRNQQEAEYYRVVTEAQRATLVMAQIEDSDNSVLDLLDIRQKELKRKRQPEEEPIVKRPAIDPEVLAEAVRAEIARQQQQQSALMEGPSRDAIMHLVHTEVRQMQRPQQSSRNLEAVQCYTCNEYGHVRRNCPSKRERGHSFVSRENTIVEPPRDWRRQAGASANRGESGTSSGPGPRDQSWRERQSASRREYNQRDRV